MLSTKNVKLNTFSLLIPLEGGKGRRHFDSNLQFKIEKVVDKKKNEISSKYNSTRLDVTFRTLCANSQMNQLIKH